MPINLQKAEFLRSAASPQDFPRDNLPQVAFAGRSNVRSEEHTSELQSPS